MSRYEIDAHKILHTFMYKPLAHAGWMRVQALSNVLRSVSCGSRSYAVVAYIESTSYMRVAYAQYVSSITFHKHAHVL